MLNRRHFLQTTAATAALAQTGPKRLAIVTTIYRYLSHGQHMGDRFLVGYPYGGAWHKPNLQVVSLYVDQKPEGELCEAARQGVQLQGLPDHRRNPPVRRRQARRRRRPRSSASTATTRATKRARSSTPATSSSSKCVESLRAGRPLRPRLQRQAPLLQLRESEGDGGDLPPPEVPDAGRLVRSPSPGDSPPSTSRSTARSNRR